MTTDLEFTAQLAKETGELLQEYFKPLGIDSERKTDRTLVTEADLAADAHILQALRAAYPQDAILSEESQHLPDLSKQAVWVIDPLDGTTNFSLGLPVWSVSIARVVDGYPETAAISFPHIDEHYTAQRGGGAVLNGQPIHTKPYSKDNPATFFACCSRTHKRYKVSIPYKTRIHGAATYSFTLAARGAALVAVQSTPKIWDLAAGWLIAEEAGAVVQVIEGPNPFPLQTGLDYPTQDFPTLVAATEEEANKARKRITPK